MNSTIEFYVNRIEGQILMDLADHDDANLYQIANGLIQNEPADKLASICQAYEVVKHELLG
ncbi:hypothetical protein [Rummeliibacillus pycnus]|uniref:hypothetical protein n=1 Tax=Rummeliibacillus pycnus TaxID=101070 RepID=UPI000C99F1A1|nr:hypothetical protein [Rummeliibacillus pycnus]